MNVKQMMEQLVTDAVARANAGVGSVEVTVIDDHLIADDGSLHDSIDAESEDGEP